MDEVVTTIVSGACNDREDFAELFYNAQPASPLGSFRDTAILFSSQIWQTQPDSAGEKSTNGIRMRSWKSPFSALNRAGPRMAR